MPATIRHGGRVPSAQQRALIPGTVMDFPTQRLYATLVFGSLQAYKVYDLFRASLEAVPEASSGLVVKWIALDCLYMAALYITRIPWLQFSLLKTLFLLTLLWSLDICVFVGPLALVASLLIGDRHGRQLSVSSGKMINVKDVLFDPSHILGKHTVHILPYGTAKLNPTDQAYCLPGIDAPEGSDDSGIYLPISMNDTAPKKIRMDHYDFDTHKTKVLQFSGDKIQRTTEIGQSKKGVESFYVRVAKAGVYQLKHIVSKDGEDVRIVPHQAFVFTCPTAKIAAPSTDLCVGDKQTLNLHVTGVPPLKLDYTRSIASATTQLKLNHIQPPLDRDDSTHSPLTHLANGLADADPAFFVPNANASYTWAARQHMVIQLNVSFDQAVPFTYQLHRIVDGAGNVVDLTPIQPQKIDVHAHPEAKFTCNHKDPVRLLHGQNGTFLPVQLKGTGPFELTYEHHDHQKEPAHVSFDHAGTQRMSVASIGEYRLLSVRDQFCKGKVLSPDNCLVIQPPLPTVKMETTPIPSECANGSEIGMRFSVDFTGTPPYTLKYTVKKRKNVVDTRQVSSAHSHYTFTYLPESSGEYTYEFSTLTDGYYTEKAKLKATHQIVHPQPNAHFVDADPRRACLGQKVTLPVKIQGTAPYTLVYMYDKQQFTEAIEGDAYKIELPPFETPGRHMVTLKKLVDANNCSKELTTSDAVIDVRRDKPTAMFYAAGGKNATIYVAQGSDAQLPLRLTGESPWQVSYRNVDQSPATIHKVGLWDANAFLSVRDTGRYELVDVQDTMCPGDVLPPDFTVAWTPRPKLAFAKGQEWVDEKPESSTYTRAGICQGADDSVVLQFTGRAPYTCRYDVHHVVDSATASLGSMFGLAAHGVKIATEDVTSGLENARVALRSDKPGTYRYKFNQLADQKYPTLAQPNPVLELEQRVHAAPAIKFRTTAPSSVCVGQKLAGDHAVWVDAVGQPPFSVHVRVHHQGTPADAKSEQIRVFDNITTNAFALDLTDTTLELSGKYQIDLLRIQDANGCQTDVAGQTDTKRIIDALDIATITPLGACGHVCVGDTLEYSLSGEGPFSVAYTFDGTTGHVNEKSNKLTMLADRAGNLTIVSVGNQRNQCQSFPTQLTSEIHAVPSSRIAGGRDVLENIHEGEMVQARVDLVGSPPFDFEWQRSELIWDHTKKHHYKGRVLESHVVHNVQEYHYNINTSIEGVIEIVSIKDRYCQYPRA
ncbi:hypothetical protein BC940DRAFT_258202 [Gongronella butleri]|nr:hypothetical protein BC940DRAFT_258202 [Gongronella butleri]